MKICFVMATKGANSAKNNYTKIAQRFTSSNQAIVTDLVSDIFTLRDTIEQLGCSYDKIVNVIFSADGLGDAETYANAIIEIASRLNKKQGIVVCDKDGLLLGYLSEAMIEYETTLKYSQNEKKPGAIYNAVFGGKVKTGTESTRKEIDEVIKRSKEEEKDAIPTPIDDDDDMPAPVDDNDEDAPVSKAKKGKGKGLFGGKMQNFFKKKARSEAVSIAKNEEAKEEPIPVIDDEEEEPLSVIEDEEEEELSAPPVFDEEELSAPPVFDEEELSAPPVFDDSDFDDEEEEYAPLPPEPKKKKNLPPPVVEDDDVPMAEPPKKGIFGKAKFNLPKVDKKSSLSMQTRPRIIYVTGTGRIGQTTLTASLGFTASQFFCKSLIIDMDMVRRGISCIFSDYSNPNSAQAKGLASAVRSPHLVDQIASEHFDNVYTLGIPINVDDSDMIAKGISALEVQSLLLQSLNKFNFIVVDMPWEYLLSNPNLISIPADILFCTSNDVMTIISDLSNISVEAFKTCEETEKDNYYQLLISKLKFVLNMTQTENKYGSKSISHKNFTDVCYQLTEDEMFETIPVLANIPFLPGIGNQVVFEKPASAYSNEFATFCASILQKLN